MKTLVRIIAAMIIVVMLVNLTGCYGSFALTKKLYNWNGSVGDKWINSAVMWILLILPIYEFTGFVDFWLLNTIEFWTGSNPVTMKNGEQDIKYASNNGKTYKITVTKNKMNIMETVGPDQGKSLDLAYSPATGNWTIDDGQHHATIASINNSNLKLFYPNGDTREIKLAR